MQAAVHRCDAGDLRHCIELSNLAMTTLTFHPGCQMLAVAPGYAGQNCIHTDPGDRLVRFGEFRQFQNGRLFLCDRGVARHACARRWKGHHPPLAGIRVAHLALEPQRQMRFVAVWNGLHGSGVLSWVIGHFLRGRLSWLRLLRCAMDCA